MSEVVALQRQPESAYISRPFTSGQFKAVCKIMNTGFDRIFRILDTAGRLIIFCIVVAFGTLHNICAKAAALLLHQCFDDWDIGFNAVFFGILLNQGLIIQNSIVYAGSAGSVKITKPRKIAKAS